MTPESVRMDRAAGTLVGLAAGDALGAGYEFGPPTTAIPRMKGGGPFGWKPGEWTDDTSMAICVAQVTATGSTNPTEISATFLDWYRSNPPDVGNQTRAVLSTAANPADVIQRAAAHFASRPNGSAGNGSLMRTAPVALAHLGQDRHLASAARHISDLTHADPIAGDACVLWCIAIDRAIRQGRLDGIRDGITLLPADRQQFWEDHITEAENKPPTDFVRNGYVVRALQAAYASVIHTPIPADTACLHLQHALHQAVQIGDDTDTVAAIAGGLLGARWGLTAIPAKWTTILHGWPGLTAADLTRLAILSARHGGSDDIGWPAAPTLANFYTQRYGSTPVIAPLGDDPGVRIGNYAALKMLAMEPADVVISLCRTGSDDLPPDGSSCVLMLMDQPGIEHNPNLDFMLRDIAAQLTSFRSEGRTVFVHCVMAESRTPTVAAAYLAERLDICGRDALERVRVVLPSVNPNPGFVDALDRLWPS
jgi:ADP-ribosyl-[dinitrogen reductase] hydrolase